MPGRARIIIPMAAVAATLILSAVPILIADGELWKSYYYPVLRHPGHEAIWEAALAAEELMKERNLT